MNEGDGTRLRVMVVDDEPPARRVLLGLLGAEPDVEIVGAYGNGEEAIQALTEEEVDVLFLDIQMPEVGGFEVLDRVDASALPLVVFVTAYDDHAIRAFEVGALDYMLKPFDDDRFQAVLSRVRARAADEDRSALRGELRRLVDRMSGSGWAEGDAATSDSPPPSTHLGRIPVRTGRRIELVDVDEVDWIEAENYYVRLHAGARSHLLRETLTRLESRLDPTKFVRVHRSAIVRIERVRELRALDSGLNEIVLKTGTRVRVSRTRRAQVMRVLGLDPDEVE